jgi:hypothetical protein
MSLSRCGEELCPLLATEMFAAVVVLIYVTCTANKNALLVDEVYFQDGGWRAVI